MTALSIREMWHTLAVREAQAPMPKLSVRDQLCVDLKVARILRWHNKAEGTKNAREAIEQLRLIQNVTLEAQAEYFGGGRALDIPTV